MVAKQDLLDLKSRMDDILQNSFDSNDELAHALKVSNTLATH
jgi:hypothetical protein